MQAFSPASGSRISLRPIRFSERASWVHVLVHGNLVDRQLLQFPCINKEVGRCTETVSDTVRRTEVEVDDDRDTLGTCTDLNRRSDTTR